MKHLQQEDFEALRTALETEQEELEEELAAHGRVQGESGDWTGTSAGFEGMDADPADTADEIEELVTNVPLVEELEERHLDVSEALDKMDEGVYGLCEECNEPIPVERLKANPAARTCIAHAEQ